MQQFLDSILLYAVAATLMFLGWATLFAPMRSRVLALMGIVLVCAWGGFIVGTAYHRATFYSGYINPLRKYSSHLHQLAEANRCDSLKKAVIEFDAEYQKDSENMRSVQNAIFRILEAEAEPAERDSDPASTGERTEAPPD